MTTTRDRAPGYLAGRLGLDKPFVHAVVDFFAHKTVPVHRHSLWYYLGGMVLFLFLVQILTGVLLLIYYQPTAETAFESVQFIMTRVQFGWLIRSLHSWSANLLVGLALVHMLSVYFLQAGRPPRELTWLSGALLLLISMAFGFTGYLLPWNTLAFFATKVGTEILGTLPLVGALLLRLARGGQEVTSATLTRFFGVHVWVLPAMLLVLLGVHLLLVQLHGMSVPPGVQRQGQRKEIPFFPSFLLRDLLGWLVALVLLAALAAIFPWELGQKADPFAPAPAGIKPEWYFVFMFQTLKYLPSHILGVEGELVGILGFGVIALLFLLSPFLRRHTPGRFATWPGVAMLIFMAVMTVLGYLP